MNIERPEATESARDRFERIHDVIRMRICLLDYAPGERLSEEALAAETPAGKRVREQNERIDALRFRETQRAKAMSELEKASSSLKDALAAAAALSAPQNEDGD